MTYKVTVVSSRPLPFEPGIKIEYLPTSDFPSAKISIETNDQSYAMSDTNSDYRTKFAISLSAELDHYTDQITFTYGPIDFYIRDYCAGLTLISQSDTIKVLTNSQNFTSNVLDEDGKAQPFTYKISKHIITDNTLFELKYFGYIKYRTSASMPAVTTGCGELVYKMTKMSWQDSF